MTTQITLDTLTEATTKELVAFYNAHNVDKPVAKFADRKTAERRVKAILETLLTESLLNNDDLPESAPVDVAPVVVHKTRASREVVESFVSPNADVPENEITEEMALAELAAMKAASAGKKESKGSKTGLTLGQAIAASWLDDGVAAKRMTRNGVMVTVNGKSAEFKSVRTAFAELGLPDAKHIRFRMLVKAEGQAIFEFNGQSYLFALTEGPSEE